jgi:hypothetical protein
MTDEMEAEEREMVEVSVKDEIFQLCDLIREVSFAIHQYLHHGHHGSWKSKSSINR